MDKAMKRGQAVRAGLKTALLLSTLLATPAYAASATPEGAKELQASVAKVIGPRLFDMGVVTIAPQGEAYALKLDYNVVAAKANAAGIKFNIDPFVYMLTPKDDGTYAVTSDSPINYSLSISVGDEKAEGKASSECKGSGVFDPKILSFSSYETSCGKLTGSSSSSTEKIEVTSGEMSFKLTGKASANGGTDLVMTSIGSDFVEKIEPVKGAKFPVTVAIKSMTSELTLENAQLTGLLPIISLLANTSDPKELVAQQDTIKKQALAALPLWNMVGAKAAATDISVETLLGTFKLASFEENIGVTGAVKEANTSFGIKYSGLELPKGPIPAWMTDLIPTEGNFDVKLGSMDLDAAAKMLIESVDASKNPPVSNEVAGKLMMMLVANPPKLALTPSTFKAGAGELGAEGSMSLFPNQKGRFTITAANLDKIIETLQSADERTKKNVMMIVGLAKGMAKAGEDGKSVWEIDFDTASRAISINGQKFGGGAAAPGDDE